MTNEGKLIIYFLGIIYTDNLNIIQLNIGNPEWLGPQRLRILEIFNKIFICNSIAIHKILFLHLENK